MLSSRLAVLRKPKGTEKQHKELELAKQHSLQLDVVSYWDLQSVGKGSGLGEGSGHLETEAVWSLPVQACPACSPLQHIQGF